MKTLKTGLLGILAAGILFSGCATMNQTQKGAVIGGGGGAVVGGTIGALISKRPGGAALGALIGATVGGGAGALIGHRMDKQAQELKQQVPGATVERVGEGIIVEFTDGVLFATNSTELNNAAFRSMDNLVEVLNRYPDNDLEVDGHTDSRGTAEYNNTLSQRRAETVTSYLASKGVSRRRMTARGFGFTAPKATNETVEGRAANRRVEFQIFANQQSRDDARRNAGN
jgi:outer membrane protein OmpA-like peptidoglycan-associated protein